MKIEQFIEDFTFLFDETDASVIQVDTKFRDLDEWSSMVIMGFIALADERYGVRIKGDEIRDSETIEDLYNLIYNKLK